MEYIVEENCENYEVIKALLGQYQVIFDKVIQTCDLSTLDYFIIADSEPDLFSESINKYADLLNVNVNVTNDEIYQVAAQTLSAHDEDDKYHQAILIKSGLLVGFCNDILVFDSQKPASIPNYSDMENLSFLTIMHEIGHTIDNENMSNLGFRSTNQIVFDLYEELDEYIYLESLSLWGEYYAEKFACGFYDDNQNIIEVNIKRKENNISECIGTYSLGQLLNQKVERIYRILYFFVQYISYFHFENSQVPLYDNYMNNDNLKGYIPYLQSIQNCIIEVDSKYPRISLEKDFEPLAKAFRSLVNFECKSTKNL